MFKKKLTRNISQRRIKEMTKQEKERPIKLEGVSGKALDPQRSYKMTFKFIS